MSRRVSVCHGKESEVVRRLITYKAFAQRLGRSTKTLDRLYARRTPRLPPIVRLGRDRAVDEALVDKFIDAITRGGGFPQQAPFTLTGAAAARAAERAAREKSKTQTSPQSARRVRRKAGKL
jgi:predicted DNA-binding transcriptional regulator AlpA